MAPTPTSSSIHLSARQPTETTAQLEYFTTTEHVTIPGKTIAIAKPTCVQTIQPDANGYLPPGTCNAIWDYYPSFAAALVFAVLFAVLTGVHVWQAARYKKTWCWVIIMASLWETCAFVFRAVSAKHQQSSGVYLVFQIFILLAPLWVNAFAYMTLGRMVYYFAPSRSVLRIPAVTLAVLFVGLDIVSFVVQLIGGSMSGPSSPADQQLKAVHIYMGGIGLQEFFIVLFVGLCVIFQRDMSRHDRASGGFGKFVRSPWGSLLCALYFSLAMITVRIVYRLVEFSGGMGQDNALTMHEAYFYALEAVPMVLALSAFVVIHPGKIMTGPDSNMPGLFASIKGWCSRRKGKQLLDDRSEDGVELGPGWQVIQESAR